MCGVAEENHRNNLVCGLGLHASDTGEGRMAPYWAEEVNCRGSRKVRIVCL